MQNSLYRITAYAYISQLEISLKNNILDHISEEIIDNLNLPIEAKDRAIQRLKTDIGFSVGDLMFRDIVDYFDYGDLLQIIQKNKSRINQNIINIINENYSYLEKVIPIRNAVMHSRPISFSDYHYIFDLCIKLIEDDKLNIWSGLKQLKKQIDQDESYVFSKYKIPDEKNNHVNHYLPFPDYDETGLIGREKDEEALRKLCYRPNVSVISVIGEGGIGKTALALKLAYDLLDDPNSPFDTVIWVSSKTTKISLIEIKEIKGAINSSLGILKKITKELSGIETNNLQESLDEIQDYLENFKIALFIDNLETILDDNIRGLVQSVGFGSKVIFTSRIGLGAYEHPIKLNGIDKKNATRFLRSLAIIRGIDVLKTLPEATLENYVQRMNLNPSYIKWFVSCVQSGKMPEEILQNSKSFLEFCMSNVYEYLSDDTKKLTQIMLCAQGARELPELQLFSNYDALKLQGCINQLLTTNMLEQKVKPVMGTSKSSYELSDLAKKFLAIKYPPSKRLREDIRKSISKLQSDSDDYNQKALNVYRGNSIKIRDKKDVVVAEQLNVVVKLIRNNKFERAQQILDELKTLSPDYFEIHRIYAYFYQQQENIQEAINCYELAIQLAPKTAMIYFWYGRFLLDEDNSEQALEILEKAYELDKSSPDIILTLIRANLYQKDFDEANRLFTFIDFENLDDYAKKQYFIQKVQYLYRTSEKAWRSNNIELCLDLLEEMRNLFVSIPEKYKHASLGPYMKKSEYFLKRIKQSSSISSEKRRADELSNWLRLQK
ncbi:tetratricopeptide repeat protein [Acinetobacter sp. GG2]|uniref:tetratricopeptide repeat protein n=1 Tax=Acinetobacter sp. GG2 TaxID=651305 RepID=UPI0003633C4B|nr:tetratricopeptide repeat protein [Acinetobacter sp. GG2]